MNDEDFIRELMFTGDIVQDADDTVSWPERERRFNRYIELLESLNGLEGVSVACAVIRSMQAEQDYGAYQTTQRTLGRFPSEVYIAALIEEVPLLIKKKSDWAGELLCGLANSIGTEWEQNITLFNSALSKCPSDQRKTIEEYIKVQEQKGWLDHRVGVLSARSA